MKTTTYTYAELASDYRLWMEYVDPSGVDSPDAWEAMSTARRMEIIVACFGEEVSKAREAEVAK